MYALGLVTVGMTVYWLSFLVLDASTPPDIPGTINQIAQEVTNTAQVLLQAIDNTIIGLTRLAFVTLLILGLFLYFTRLHRRLGRDLIFGGVALALISEFLIPAIARF
jgi:uncharacterized membrane protein